MSHSRYTRLAVWLSGMLLAAAACGGGGSGYHLTGASAATHAKAATTQPHAAGTHCQHRADAQR